MVELSDTVREALKQIEKKDYQAALTARGIPKERIRKYGFVISIIKKVRKPHKSMRLFYVKWRAV